MSYENILYEKQGAVAYITLNRPEKLNALSDELQAEVRDALEDAGWTDDAIRVIVLKASGRAFSAGFDITTSARVNAVERRAKFLKGKTFSASGWWDVFWNNPKPIIAMAPILAISSASNPIAGPSEAVVTPSTTKEILKPAERAKGPSGSCRITVASMIGNTGKTHGLISVSNPAMYPNKSSISFGPDVF